MWRVFFGSVSSYLWIAAWIAYGVKQFLGIVYGTNQIFITAFGVNQFLGIAVCRIADC